MPRQGYRMVALVGPWASEPVAAPAAAVAAPSGKTSHKTSRSRVAAMAMACIAAAFGIGLWLQNSFANGHGSFLVPAAGPGHAVQYRNSIAVLPFLDLTEGMGREIFADGMAEELIDRLSRIPGYKVPSPASSFYFKGKHVPVADIGKQLGVNYVLSGSVRSSGTTLRVAARLIQADNGFIIWSETYDRPVDDLLKVQEDIAGAVANALKGMIEGSIPHPKSS
jgi:TolB-like protein